MQTTKEAGSSYAQPTGQAAPPQTKVFVVVHGVGEQLGNATSQSVANRISALHGGPAGFPRGRFPRSAPFAYPYPPAPKQFAFSEAYWADIPKSMQSSSYRVEPPRSWGRSIVERLRLRRNMARTDESATVEQVLDELIDAIGVAERLCKLADHAGLGNVALPQLVDAYLGDVQVVAEFDEQRGEIVDRFEKAMIAAQRANPGGDIYIIAHSEGTVVTLLGLLKAFRAAEPEEWTKQVRGVMTIGSPIDKHLYMWPELFGDDSPKFFPGLDNRITWRNYYDYSDPIGFELDGFREWLQKNDKWSRVFDFQEKHDFGFSRYPLPGKAHVDYWGDDDVFGHFLSDVVYRGNGLPGGRAKPYDAPRPHWWVPIVSYGIPYLMVFALLFIAGMLIFKNVMAAGAPDDPLGDTMKNVALGSLGLASLLGGITIVSRLPRLLREWPWRVGAAVAGLAGWWVYKLTLGAIHIPDAFLDVNANLVSWTALLVVVVSFLFGIRKPRSATSLIVIGSVAIAAVVTYHLAVAKTDTHPIGSVWPVILAVIGAAYLWWLAALLFDLVVVWHRYIRWGMLMKVLKR